MNSNKLNILGKLECRNEFDDLYFLLKPEKWAESEPTLLAASFINLISDVQLHQGTQVHCENIVLSKLVQISHIKLLELKTDTAIRNYWKKCGV